MYRVTRKEWNFFRLNFLNFLKFFTFYLIKKSIFQFFGRNKRLNFVSNPVSSESSFKNESVSNMKGIIGQNVKCFPGGRKDD